MGDMLPNQFKDFMSQKMYYTTCGYMLTFANIALIGTRFSQIGILFGIIAAGYFIKALSIRL